MNTSLHLRPEEIEAESFRIIDEEAGAHGWADAEWQVVRRAIHTSADFEYANSLSGISKARLAPLGCTVSCHVADADVADLAKQEGITRSIAAMRKAVRNPANRIVVIGNAPTALFELLRLMNEGLARPALIVGLPVGFVGAEESKNALATAHHNIPFITNIGRKGGSNVAAAVINALAILAAAQ